MSYHLTGDVPNVIVYLDDVYIFTKSGFLRFNLRA